MTILILMLWPPNILNFGIQAHLTKMQSPIELELPSDISRPFFAYGIFKPGQIGFLQLRELVRTAESNYVNGSLLLRDGLPIFDPGGRDKVKGALLHFIDKAAAEKAYRRISKLEPDNHYNWAELPCDGTTANILIGRSPQKGSVACEDQDWDGWKDPLFNAALEVVEEVTRSQGNFEWDLKPLFRLQMAYLLLWSAIERYVSLRYHLGIDVSQKIGHLANEPAFGTALQQYVHERRSIFRADRPGEKIVLDPAYPKKSKDYYYQIRSNITHRGKAATRDHDLLFKSLNELLPIFRDVLNAAQRDAVL